MRYELAELHAKTTSYKYKVYCAKSIISRAIEKCVEINYPGYVSFSGGKDSTVVHAMVVEQAGNIPAVWSDDEWWLPETSEYIKRMQDRYDIRQIRTNAKHTDWFTVNGDYDGIPDYARQNGWALAYIGLRQEESKKRKLHLRKFGSLYFAQIDDCWHCNPIHNWTWKDVWAYIVTNDLDYNKAYDRLEELGVEPQYQRIGPLAVERVLEYGQLVILKHGWPDLYNKFVAKHPEATVYS